MVVIAKETRSYVKDIEEPVVRRGVIDLHALWQVVRAEKVLVASIVAVFMLLAIAYLHMTPRKYAVRMVLTGVQTHSESSSTLDDLSSMAGLDLGGPSSNPQFKMFIGALRSPFAAQSIASDPELLKAMFPREWSVKENRWRQPPSALRPALEGIARVFGFYVRPWTPPGVARVFDYLRDELKIVPDTKSGVVTMELDSRYPDAAVRILLALNSALDERIRQRDLIRASTDVDYLTQRLSAVAVQEYRAALVTNLVQQEKQRMLASAPLPYVSDALGKPLILTNPVSPIPMAVLIAALIIGFMVAIPFANARYRKR